MHMKNPSHPGSVIRHGCLEYVGLTVTEAAKFLGVSRQALNNVVNEKSAVSAEMAIRLSKGLRQHAGPLVANAGGLRPCSSTEERLKNPRETFPSRTRRLARPPPRIRPFGGSRRTGDAGVHKTVRSCRWTSSASLCFFLGGHTSSPISTFMAPLTKGGSIDNGAFLSLLGIGGQVAYQ